MYTDFNNFGNLLARAQAHLSPPEMISLIDPAIFWFTPLSPVHPFLFFFSNELIIFEIFN